VRGEDNMDKINILKASINPLSSINENAKIQEEKRTKMLESIGRANIEKIEREKRSIELQETIVEQNDQSLRLQEIEIDFLKNMSQDTRKIVNLIKSLEIINTQNGKMIESNLLEIEKQLENIIENTSPENLYEAFINETKSSMIDRGVNYAIQFILMGLKTLITIK